MQGQLYVVSLSRHLLLQTLLLGSRQGAVVHAEPSGVQMSQAKADRMGSTKWKCPACERRAGH